MSVAFCIGNGESRQGYNVDNLAQYGKVYAANAFHRDFTPHYLICCDQRMVDEALLNKNYFGPIFTRKKWISRYSSPRVKALPDFSWKEDQKWQQSFHWGSGLHGVHLACKQKSKVIVCVGHDLYGIKGKHNNIYKSTNNYLNETEPAVDPSFWIKQFLLLFQKFPDIQLYMCQTNASTWFIPENWPNQIVTNISPSCFQIRRNVYIHELSEIQNELSRT